ncbi:hypothetical protein R3Q06_36170 [Rhodococcus erythropolis]|uniref:hypothetical protein n=1 Tax=Rhodococcus erythropolis TaxID=1833 RepID=UPI0029491C8D|nr:hypothetical protein [Rhodococcus erythropolis]MDV6278804.1 hypothetical protein [Rhodococcus erythropolis]
MNAVMNISKNKNWLRKAAYTPLAVAIVAGAVYGGAGIGSAATDTDADVGTGTTLPDPAPFRWSVVNGTGQPIYGKMELHEGLRNRSYEYASTSIERPKDRPWEIDDHESTGRPPTPSGTIGWYTGRICYNKQWRDFGSGSQSWFTPDEMHSSVAHLEVDSKGTLHLVENVYGWSGKTWRTPFANTGIEC